MPITAIFVLSTFKVIDFDYFGAKIIILVVSVFIVIALTVTFAVILTSTEDVFTDFKFPFASSMLITFIFGFAVFLATIVFLFTS